MHNLTRCRVKQDGMHELFGSRCVHCGMLAEEIGELKQLPTAKPVEAKREPVPYLYNSLNWDFIKEMARVATYAAKKYGTAEQYTESRLVGDKSPINHIPEHLRQYVTGEVHDHFHTLEAHLVVIAYNAMMEFYYLRKYGQLPNPFDTTKDL